MAMAHTAVGSGERVRRKTGFFIDTQGYCFLCSSQISSSSEAATVTPTPTCSLQYLSRFLKLNLGKVFNEEVKLLPEVVCKLEKGILGARLCEGCAVLNDKFSELCGQLERIRMEVEHCLSGIHRQLVGGEDGWKRSIPAERTPTLRIADALRKQTLEKCSLKLRSSQPRILLKKLTVKTFKVIVPNAGNQLRNDVGEPETAVDDSPVTTREESEVEVVNLDDDNYDNDFDMAEPEELPTPTTPHYDHTRSSESPEVLLEKLKPVNPQRPPPSAIRVVIDRAYSLNSATGEYRCNLCGTEFKCRDHWSIHYRIDHPKVKPTHKCPICSKEFRTPADLSSHHQGVHLGMRFRCKTCGKISLCRRKIEAHQRQSGGTCRFGEEEVEFVQVPSVLNRMKRKKRMSDHYTGICEKASSGRWKCKKCSKEFQSPSACHIHFMSVHQKVRQNCSQCDKTFTSKTTLLRHRDNVHFGVRYKCEFCGIMMRQAESLDKHQSRFCRKNPSLGLGLPRPQVQAEVIQQTSDDAGQVRETSAGGEDPSSGQPLNS